MRGLNRLALGTCVAAVGLVAAGAASANQYVGTLGTRGTASIAGTLIKCIRSNTGEVACFVTKAGAPDPKSWAMTVSDTSVQAGMVSSTSAAYTSPKQPKASGSPGRTGIAKLTAKVGQNFGIAGSHVVCSVLTVGGKIGVACGIVGTQGAIAGSYGAFMTTHEVQVRTAQGAKSKVLFDKKF